MRSRYFKNASAAKINFQWLGRPVSPREGNPSQLHYQSFLMGELTLKLGDYALVRSSSNTSLMECDVVRVDKLYQDYNNKTDPYRAEVTWLCRPIPGMLPANLDSGHGLEEQGVPPLDPQYEVVGEARLYEKTISAESIYYKCHVVQGSLNDVPKVFSKKNEQGKFPCYLHRFDMVVEKNKKKKSYSLEPLLMESSKNKTPSKKRVLSENCSNVEAVLKKEYKISTPNKNSLEVPQITRSRRSSRCSESPSELSSFVTGTVTSSLDGGYWDTQEGKRTPKPKVRGTEDKLKEKLIETELATNSGRKLKIKFGTQMESTTGSGRKVTIKCGSSASKKKFAPSSGLANAMISSMLDSDTEESIVKGEKPATRKRRASVSCTTPSRKPPSTKTTPRKVIATKARPASEVKATRASRRSVTIPVTFDSDDEFVPVTKGTRGKKDVSESEESISSEDSSSSEEESDDEPVIKKRNNTRVGSKSSSGPKTPKRVFKPSVAPRSKPLPTDVDPLTEAQQRLHVSAVPDSLPCREEEFAEIFTYVEGKLREGRGGCYYISGVPGTGKTATVMEVIRMLQENKDEYPDFNFYAMNGMRLTSPEQAYVDMWRQLTGEKATPEHAMKLLDARFSKAAPKRSTSVFLVDELDMLCNRKQSVLYNMFDWPSRPEGKLIVIAIANTMDLPERVMINRVSSRLGLTRQTFQPYTHEQLQMIVASRLAGLQVFQQDAVQLVARKVASLSGDARRALDICRRATEMAESSGQTKIGLKHVTAAYQEMFTSPKIQAIRSCSKYEQLALQALCSEFHRTGVEESNVGAIYRELTISLRTEGLEVISLPGCVALLAGLAAMRLLLTEHFRHGLETKIRLNVASDDIQFALKKTEDD